MEPIYHHCQNCRTPTQSKTGYCQECKPEETTIRLSFAKRKRTLEDLRFIAQRKEIRPTQYIMDLIEKDIKQQIEEVNKQMKRTRP